MHLVVVLPDDKEKEFNQIKIDILKKIKEDKLKIWLNLFLEKDLLYSFSLFQLFAFLDQC